MRASFYERSNQCCATKTDCNPSKKTSLTKYNVTITNQTNHFHTMTATLSYTLLLAAIYLVRKLATMKTQAAA